MAEFIFNSTKGYVEVSEHLANRIISNYSVYCQEEEIDVFKDVFPCWTQLSDIHFSCISYERGKLWFPTGLLKFILCHFKDQSNSFQFNRIKTELKKDIELEECLRPHQLEYINAITKYKRGFIQAYTSFGKSKAFINFINQFVEGTKILILVPTTTLLVQMTQDIVDCLGISKDEIGQIGAGSFNPKNITVCIPDTVYSRMKKGEDNATNYLESVQVLVADEMHFYCNATGATVINSCINAEYRLGTSATPTVKFDWFNESVFGPCLRQFKQDEGIQLNYIENPHIYFVQAPGSYVAPRLLKAISNKFSHAIYNQVYKAAIVKNTARNKLVAQLADRLIKLNEGPIVILFKQLEHADLLKEQLSILGYTEVPIIKGSTASKKRETVINQMKNEEIPVVLASENILGTGSSITSLAGAINAAGGRSENLLIQKLGRIVRNRNTNQRPYFIDFDDINYFSKQSNSRYRNCLEHYNDVKRLTAEEFYDCI